MAADIIFNDVMKDLVIEPVRTAFAKDARSRILPDGRIKRGIFIWRAHSISAVGHHSE